MRARIYRIHQLSEMDNVHVGNGGGRQSVGEFVRQWGPYLLTALIVPGGIFIALLLLVRQWNQKRQAVASPVRA